ncbi:MAG: hypothetical protein GY820_38595 [Gammaproteobacteria bacterium]|nr:hypothetical protein [Gammaproteobacteria bacterium]
MSMIHTFDIETIPGQKPELFESFLNSAKENASKETARIYETNTTMPRLQQHYIDKLDKDTAKHAEHKWRRTALDAMYGEIISIAWKNDHGKTQSITRTLDNHETDLLNEYFSLFTKARSRLTGDVTFTGHNIRYFDMQFIRQRCMILDISLPTDFDHALQTRPNDFKRIFDTMLYWSGAYNRENRKKLNDLCIAFDVPTPKSDGMDGSKVWDFIKAGKYEKVNEYNMADVDATDELAVKMGVDDIFNYEKVIQNNEY